MIKLFEQFNNEQEIREICEKYNIINYTINSDGSIDVDGFVDMIDRDLTKIPIKFNKVNDGFYCYDNKLTSLEGSPNDSICDFLCNDNKLTSLEGCSERIGGKFICYKNELISLVGGPKGVQGDFDCSSNKLTSLKGAPIIIYGDLFLGNNPISIIDYSVEVKGYIYIDGTNFDDKVKSLSQEKLKILFEHGVDYNIFDKDGNVSYSRLERMFKDFNI